MAMRYLIRRDKSEQFGDLKQTITDLDAQLGTPGADLRRLIRVPFSPVRHALFAFFTKKEGAGYVWTCPSIEVVAEDEKGLFQMLTHFKVPKPSHLAHLPD